MRIVKILVLSFVLLAGLRDAAQAADIAFLPVESTTLAPQDASALGELLAQSYASASGQSVLAPSRIEADGRSATELAAALSVPEYVRTDAIQVGSRIVVHSVRYRSDGSAIYQVKLTAERIDDLISVCDRIAKALYQRVDDEAVRTRHNVTLSEARAQSRRWTEKVIGFKTGVSAPFAKGADYSPSLLGAFNMRLEMDRYFLEFGAGVMIPTDTRDYAYTCADESCSDAPTNEARIGGLSAEIGGSYFLTNGNIAPYVGGGLMPRLVVSSSSEIAQMSPFVQLGLTLPRDSGTRFYGQVRFAQSVIGQRLDNGKEVYPTEAIFEAGIGW